MIALTVEEGQDWKDVQIPGKQIPSSKKSEAIPAAADDDAAPVSSSVSAEAAELRFVPGVGPATNLLLAQYGIDPR